MAKPNLFNFSHEKDATVHPQQFVGILLQPNWEVVLETMARNAY